MHSRHLAFLRQGLLLADEELAVVTRDILNILIRLSGLIDRWGGSVLPLNDENKSSELDNRQKAITEIKNVRPSLFIHAGKAKY